MKLTKSVICFSAPNALQAVCRPTDLPQQLSSLAKRRLDIGQISHSRTRRAQVWAATTSPPNSPTAAWTTTATTGTTAATTTVSPQCAKCKTRLPEAGTPIQETHAQVCLTCKRKFPRRGGYIDLTEQPGKYLLPRVTDAVRQTLFQLPVVAYVYERGWRDNFSRAGFPGPAAEADIALDFLAGAHSLLDVSCGSGIMARELAVRMPETRLLASDISHPMLLEAGRRAKADVRLGGTELFRADVANLPFTSGSLDGVHSGAALHCWPSVQDGLSEVCRVLKPSGRFFATTFHKDAYYGRTLQPISTLSRSLGIWTASPFLFFENDELIYLLRAAGFADIRVENRNGFMIVKCIKGPHPV